MDLSPVLHLWLWKCLENSSTKMSGSCLRRSCLYQLLPLLQHKLYCSGIRHSNEDLQVEQFSDLLICGTDSYCLTAQTTDNHCILTEANTISEMIRVKCNNTVDKIDGLLPAERPAPRPLLSTAGVFNSFKECLLKISDSGFLSIFH